MHHTPGAAIVSAVRMPRDGLQYAYINEYDSIVFKRLSLHMHVFILGHYTYVRIYITMGCVIGTQCAAISGSLEMTPRTWYIVRGWTK